MIAHVWCAIQGRMSQVVAVENFGARVKRVTVLSRSVLATRRREEVKGKLLLHAFEVPALRTVREDGAPTVLVVPARSKAWATRQESLTWKPAWKHRPRHPPDTWTGGGSAAKGKSSPPDSAAPGSRI